MFNTRQVQLEDLEVSRACKTIILADFNVRLGSITGDARSNERQGLFLTWQHNNYLHLWNTTEAYAQATFQRSNGSSIIDFILSQPAQLSVHDFQIYDEESFGSYHLLVTSSIILPTLLAALQTPNHAPLQ
ncbi:hypothetical protein [Parasitella parasitica]|uniref:Endonuclease/exonuclease/phosphatase domain-containing protein n=1 Tax=Parasitella parasitica TaxID=35722 RepID=A0A0B7NW81_9FUNG|nr:hypothetical protein [Parasitella parasitica]